MNVNIYVEDELGKEINQMAQLLGKSRNAIIREALKEWVIHHSRNEWPDIVKNYAGVKDFPRFEDYRDELTDKDEEDLF
jgi:predicted transcriptional regulator